MRKLPATSTHAAREVTRLAPAVLSAPAAPGGRGRGRQRRWSPATGGRRRGGRGQVMVAVVLHALRVLARAGLRGRRHEQAQRQRHQRDHHHPAEVLGERELPADQHPQHEAQLPHEVGRGELERQRGRRGGALGEQRAGDRHRRVGARGGGRPEAGRERHGLRPFARQRACTRSRGTHACTIALIAKPSTSAHHTSHAISSESRRPCQITSSALTRPTRCSCNER